MGTEVVLSDAQSLLTSLLHDLERRCELIKDRLSGLDDPDTRAYVFVAYDEIEKMRREIMALRADPTLGWDAFRRNQFAQYRLRKQRLSILESYTLPFVERYSDQDRRLTRLCQRLLTQVHWPLPPPLVTAFSSQYYWVPSAADFIAAPATETMSLVGLPDMCHELGHLLWRHRHADLVGEFVNDILKYIRDQLHRIDVEHRLRLPVGRGKNQATKRTSRKDFSFWEDSMEISFSLPLGVQFTRQPESQSGKQEWLLTMTADTACCPHCRWPSQRVHSHYQRTLADLPASGETICLHVRLRRFFCNNRLCRRKTFAEPLGDLARRYARRTERLRDAQTSIGQFVGSRPGVRLASWLAMPTSATTLLRMERAAPVPAHETPRVLGVDDWAFRKGHHYGTILYDLEQHWVVDLLPDRTTETLTKWLSEHPGVEIVSRDRAEAYANAIRQGAPDAQQVTDRWHLVKNLGQALERLLEGKSSLLKQAAAPEGDSVLSAAPVEPSSPAEPPPPNKTEARMQQQKECRRQCRLERYEEVRALFAKGWKVSAIARYLDLSRKTVQKFIATATFPERKERAARVCRLDAYKPYLLQRWQDGCHNGAVLFEEVRQRGYPGGYTMLREYLRTLCQTPTPSQQQAREKVSARQIAVWTLRCETDRTVRQQSVLNCLATLCDPFQIASSLTARFLGMVRQNPRSDQSETFREWLADAFSCGVVEIYSFATGLKQDQSAVEAGLSLPWSNGPVEGSNNRLKFVKRRGYGRASFDLLRRRVLQAI